MDSHYLFYEWQSLPHLFSHPWGIKPPLLCHMGWSHGGWTGGGANDSTDDGQAHTPPLRGSLSAEYINHPQHNARLTRTTFTPHSGIAPRQTRPPTNYLFRWSCAFIASVIMSNMATEIVAFILTTSGWVLVSSTLPMDYWKVSSLDGTVITTATFWSNLWKACVTDSTGVSNCKDFPSMLALDGLLPFS